MEVDLRTMLSVGDRRTLGRVAEVVAWFEQSGARVEPLVELLWDSDPGVRMRAADALEKLSRTNPTVLHPWKAELLGLLLDAQQAELLWHLEQMAARVELTADERRRLMRRLRNLVNNPSSIVKTNALQAMWDLSQGHAALRAEMVEFFSAVTGTNAGSLLEFEEGPVRVTAAMRSRARLLLKTGLHDGC